MDTTTILNAIANVINQAVTIGPTVITSVEDAIPFAEAIYDKVVNKTEVTQADLDALDVQVSSIVAQALTPLPDDTAS